ncbi:MAG: hypothetical protein HW416_221 [Chloroflexi bacterium]|nr:hypothetical protein [Chloroflexota bacterium]
MDVGLRLAVVLALVAANGFFVAAEFALVTARRTRIEQLAARGNRAAVAVLRAIKDPNRFISACQLGITVASLALGWIGEGVVAELLEPPLAAVFPQGFAGLTSHVFAVAIAFTAITFFHITLGEQVPKMLALQKGEATALFTVGPTNLIGLVFRPFIALLYWFTDLVLRLMGTRWQSENHQSYSTEDLKLMLQSSRAAGSLAADPQQLVERALDFARLEAHHVMVPRTEMVSLPKTIELTRFADLMQRFQHSRYPVFDDSPDNILGVVAAKSLVGGLVGLSSTDGAVFDLTRFMHPPMFVPESMRADKLLAAMKQERSHLAIVVDEYGVTAGVVTLRDLLDRIAGEVGDEARAEIPQVEWLPDGSASVDGLALLSDVAAALGVQLDEDDYDTLGGLIFGRLGRRPIVGDTIDADGRTFIVDDMDGLRVSRVRVRKRIDEQAATSSPAVPI